MGRTADESREIVGLLRESGISRRSVRSHGLSYIHVKTSPRRRATEGKRRDRATCQAYGHPGNRAGSRCSGDPTGAVEIALFTRGPRNSGLRPRGFRK